MRHKGTYKCESTNPPGAFIYNVVVKILCEPPSIESPSEDTVLIDYMGSKTIACIAEGKPKPSVLWTSLTTQPAIFRLNILSLTRVSETKLCV